MYEINYKDQFIINSSKCLINIIADVVYDLSIIPPLVRLLNNCLIVSETNCTIYIASTIRNNETRDSFIHHLG